MTNWLSRATSLFQQAPPQAEPFEVECDCGGQVRGIRTATYQKPKCPTCERPVFVLPLNAYPVYKIPGRKANSSGTPRPKDGLTNPKSAVRVLSDPPAVDSKTKPPPGEDAGDLPIPSRDEIVISAPISRQITPLRLVTVAIVLTSALAVGGLWHRNRIERAKAIVAQSADAGIEAIRERNFVKAHLELSRANYAVDLIGRTDQAANDIRRISREANAMAKLASSTLSEILEETLSSRKSGQFGVIPLSSVNKGAWLILDGRIISTEEKGRFTVDAPITIGEMTVQMEITSPAFRNLTLIDESGEPTRVIFAAQLDQLMAVKEEPSVALLRLNGKTAFLWSEYDDYTAIGYEPVDEEGERQTRQLLERQQNAQHP